MPGKILVIRGGAIGDFILTLPVLAALRQQFPQARIEVLGYSHIAQLARFGGLADDVRSIDARPMAGFFARNGVLDETLQEYFSSFAIIISYLFDPDKIFQTNVARCSGAQFIAGPHRPDERAGLHATSVFLGPLQRLAIFDADPVPRLKLRVASGSSTAPDSDIQRRDACPTLAIHPGSGSDRKNWPEAKWAELLSALSRVSALKILLVGGEAEGDRLTRLAQVLPPPRLHVLRNLPLPQLAENLSNCAAFLGHDSGITHLAAAVGLPLYVLWGDSAEAIWRPQAERLTILRHPSGLKELPVKQVLDCLAFTFASEKTG